MKKSKFVAPVVAGMILLAPLAVKAAEVPTFDMQEIVIIGDAFRKPITEDSINVKYINPAKTATLPEVLSQSAGIDIQLRGTIGDNQDGTVKLRGYDARRFTVLLNGRPINSAGVMGGQYIDWNIIPLHVVDKIQIIKGAKSAQHGGTLGGVINIVTREHPSGGEAVILMGDQGRQGYFIQQGGEDKRFSYDFYANHQSANAFLRNNDFKQDQYGMRLGWGTDRDKLLVGLNYTETRRGFIVRNDSTNTGGVVYDPSYPTALGDTLSPGSGNGPTAASIPRLGSYWNKRNLNFDITYRHSTKNGQWELSYWRNDERRREVNYSTAGAVVLDRDVVTDLSDSFGFSGKEKIKGHEFRYGADYKRWRYGDGTWYVNSAGSSAMYPSQKIDLFGLYVDDTWKLNKRWNAYLGIRYDSFAGRPDSDLWTNSQSADFSGLTPRMSLTWKHNASTTSYISVNRLWRAPSMAEFYWWGSNYNLPKIQPYQPAAQQINNPSYHKQIKPEYGMGYELGIDHRFSKQLTAKIGIYYHSLTDYILFQHVLPYACYNIDQVNLWGMELESQWKVDKRNSLMLNYTYQRTQKTGQATQDTVGLSDELDYRPQHKIGLSWLYDAKPWQVRYTFNYVSPQRDGMTTAGTVYTIEGYTVHNLEIVRDLGKQRTLSLYVQNLFDQSYTEQYGYPMPGRRFMLAFKQAW